MRAARWGPPPYIPAPWAGFGASVKRKPRTGCYDPAVRQGTPATLLLPVSRIADLEPHRHFAPAFLGHPAARRRLEAPFRQRPLLRRLDKGRAVPAHQFDRPDPPVGAAPHPHRCDPPAPRALFATRLIGPDQIPTATVDTAGPP